MGKLTMTPEDVEGLRERLTEARAQTKVGSQWRKVSDADLAAALQLLDALDSPPAAPPSRRPPMLSEQNANEIDRLCEALSLDWDGKRQMFVSDDGDLISRRTARALAEGATHDRLAAGSLDAERPTEPRESSEPPKLSGEVGEEEHGRTAMIAEMVRSYAHTDPDPSRAHYARKAADALLSQARLLEERTRERDRAKEWSALRAQDIIALGNSVTKAEARAEAAERLLEEVVGVLDDHRVITHVGPDQGDSGPLVKLSPAERLREALTKDRAYSEGGKDGSSQGLGNDQCADGALPILTARAAVHARVKPWMHACFGEVIPNDRTERGDRLLEEVFELLQSGGYDPARVAELRDYTWNRPPGEPSQEVGGVMVTLAAYCLAHGLDMHEAGETELARIWTKVEAIRAKQAAKPRGIALPVDPATLTAGAVSPEGE